MNVSRNFLFARSILFGAAAKIIGGAVVFLGLPLIANQLTVEEYSLFLRYMSWSSLILLIFGVAHLAATQVLASASQLQSADATSDASNETLTFFFSLTIAAIAISVAFFMITQDMIFLLVCALVTINGTAMWADAYRIALRIDYKSSLVQIISSTALLVAFIFFVGNSLVWTSIVYFGIPAITQLAIFLYEMKYICKRPMCRLSHAGLGRLYINSIPFVLNSSSEYMRVYGSSIVVWYFLGDAEYAKVSSEILIIARLINPISLITRPLLPALIDAIASQDQMWIAKFRAALVILGISAIIVFFCLIFGPIYSVVRSIIPSIFYTMTYIEYYFLSSLICTYGIMALLLPVFQALGRIRLFVFVGALSNTLAIAAGIALLPYFGGGGMIIALGTSSAASSLSMLAFAYFLLRR